ncbi:Nadh dehydrogenase iron-sulfur protein 7, partial [Globisporangium splendens]
MRYFAFTQKLVHSSGDLSRWWRAGSRATATIHGTRRAEFTLTSEVGSVSFQLVESMHANPDHLPVDDGNRCCLQWTNILELAGQDFPTKYAYFVATTEVLLIDSEPIKVDIARMILLEDSVVHLSALRQERIRSVMRTSFVDETGVDAGGLYCEWFVLLNQEISDTMNGMLRMLWVRENRGVGMLGLDFSGTEKRGDTILAVDLIENGWNIEVTDENNELYPERQFRYLLFGSVSSQLYVFLKGVYEVIPHGLLMLFDSEEFDYLLRGSDDIDIDDWVTNTKCSSNLRGHKVLQWSWELVRDMSNELPLNKSNAMKMRS